MRRTFRFKLAFGLAAVIALCCFRATGAAASRPYEIPVLVVHFFPTNGANIDIRVTGDYAETLELTRQKTQRQTHEVVEALEQGSRYRAYIDSNAAPALDYKVVGSVEFLTPLPVHAKRGHKLPVTDYRQIMQQLNIADWVQNKGVKQVWIWAYHGGKVDLWESNMSSPFGDVSNSDRDENDLPVLDRTYTVFHYNYQRGTSEAVEDHMHQLEALFNYVDGRDNTPTDQWPNLLFWGHFVGSDHTHKIIRPGCGWAHYPPNGERDYDWANPKFVETDMDDWKPDGTGRKAKVNCDRWGGKSLNWFVYWMQHLPGPENTLTWQGRKLQNWWVFVADYDFARKQKLGLVTK